MPGPCDRLHQKWQCTRNRFDAICFVRYHLKSVSPCRNFDCLSHLVGFHSAYGDVSTEYVEKWRGRGRLLILIQCSERGGNPREFFGKVYEGAQIAEEDPIEATNV